MQDGDTALFVACRFGFTAIVDILLHNGANVNTENSVNLNLKAISHSLILAITLPIPYSLVVQHFMLLVLAAIPMLPRCYLTLALL